MKAIFLTGTAGAGKTLLATKISEYYTKNGVFPAILNLDPGVESLPYSPDIDVRDFVDKDIVFTTYGIMAVENGQDRTNHVLHQIEWHRIILDESHYIKAGNVCTSKSIDKLHGVNKWCLAGTPFGGSINDIFNQKSDK